MRVSVPMLTLASLLGALGPLGPLGSLGCKPKPLQPEPGLDASTPASASASASTAPTASAASVAPPASASASPAEPPVEHPPLTPEVSARVERWRARIGKRYAGLPKEMGDPSYFVGHIEMVNTRHGDFDVIVANVPTPVMAGGADDTHQLLVVTKQGELALQDAPPVVGLADVNGDGRMDLVLKDVTVVADMSNGPLALKLAAKGGAYGWRECRIGSHEGKPAIVATTETNVEREIGAMRAGGYMDRHSKGVLEAVTLQWDGKRLAQVDRKPIETPEQAAERERKFVEENKEQEARIAANKVTCVKDCPAQCARYDGGAKCVTECVVSCKRD